MLSNRKNQYLIMLAFFFVIALVAFILGSKFDYSISKFLFDKYQLNIPFFSIVLCLVCPLIVNLFGAFAGTTLFLTINSKSKALNIILKIAAVMETILIGFFAYSSGTEFVKVIPNITTSKIAIGEMMTLFIVIVSDLLVAFFTWKNIKKMEPSNAFWTSLTMLLVIAAIAFSSEVIKYLASRPRPRLIFTDNSFSFKEWYQWNPFYGLKVSEAKSFVSGHSINSAATLTLLPMFLSLTRLNEKKFMIPVAIGVAGLYWIIVVISRILAIAHFLTDVSGGGILAILLQVLVLFIVDIIKKKTGDLAPVSK